MLTLKGIDFTGHLFSHFFPGAKRFHWTYFLLFPGGRRSQPENGRHLVSGSSEAAPLCRPQVHLARRFAPTAAGVGARSRTLDKEGGADGVAGDVAEKNVEPFGVGVDAWWLSAILSAF